MILKQVYNIKISRLQFTFGIFQTSQPHTEWFLQKCRSGFFWGIWCTKNNITIEGTSPQLTFPRHMIKMKLMEDAYASHHSLTTNRLQIAQMF